MHSLGIHPSHKATQSVTKVNTNGAVKPSYHSWQLSAANPENLRYLRTKQERMGHMLSETIEDEAKADTSPESEPMKGRAQSEGPPVLGS